jgi:hypothetical protein
MPGARGPFPPSAFQCARSVSAAHATPPEHQRTFR